MKRASKITALIILTILNTRCYTYVPISMELPPEIKVPDEKIKFGLVNNYDYTKIDYTENKEAVFKEGIKTLMASFETGFLKDTGKQLVIIDTLVRGNALYQVPETGLTPDSAMQLCAQNRVNYVLMIDSYDIDMDKNVDIVKNEDGSKTKTAYFDLVVSAGISLYNNEGKRIDHGYVQSSQYYKSREVASAIFTIKPAIGKAGEEVDLLSADLAEQYLNKFYPTMVFEIRQFYIGKPFKEIRPYVDAEDWQHVIKLTLPFVNSGDGKIKQRAAKNIAVAYEASGDIESANRWYEKAMVY